MKINRMDHVGINVENIEAMKNFFVALGMEVQGEMDVQGEWVDKIIGLKGVSDRIVMLGLPGGAAEIELVQFHHPKDENGRQPSQSNTLGMRHICLNVDDVEEAVSIVKEHGGELMGEIHDYENIFRLCYVRGPEGIIVELAQQISEGDVFKT